MSPKNLKRLSSWTGQLYAMIFLLAPLGFIVGKMQSYAEGDPAATMAQLLEHETVFRFGLLAEVGVVLVELVIAALMYQLFRPVSRSLALGAAITRAVEAAIQAVNLIPSMIALAAANGTGVYATVSVETRETVVLGAMDAYQDMILIWGIPFALHVAFLGLLVIRSGLVSRLIGWLLMAASAAYLLDSVFPMVAPAWSGFSETAVLIAAIPAELAFAVWLIVRGVRADRWQQLAAADASAQPVADASPTSSGTHATASA